MAEAHFGNKSPIMALVEKSNNELTVNRTLVVMTTNPGSSKNLSKLSATCRRLAALLFAPILKVTLGRSRFIDYSDVYVAYACTL